MPQADVYKVGDIAKPEAVYQIAQGAAKDQAQGQGAQNEYDEVQAVTLSIVYSQSSWLSLRNGLLQ